MVYLIFLLLGIATSSFATPLLTLPLPSQSKILPPVMTLHDAIVLALRNNPNVRIAELTRVTDKFSLAVARNKFEPQYSFTSNANYAEGSGPNYGVTPEVSLTTPLGTQLSVGVANNFDSGGSGSAVNFSVTQPLLRGFGTDVTLSPLRSAVDAEITARLTLKNTVMTTITTVVSDYYGLVQAYNGLGIDQQSLNNAEQTLFNTEERIKVGKAPGSDALQQQANIASQKFTIQKDYNAIIQATQTLLNDLGLDPNASIRIVKKITVPQVKLPNEADAFQLALRNNISYQQRLITMRGIKRALLLAKDQQKWQLNLTANASADLSQSGDGGNTGFIADNNAAPGRSVGLTLNIPIDNLTNQQVLLNAKIALEQEKITLANARRNLETDVINALEDLKDQQQQIVLAENAVRLDRIVLDNALRKLQYGKITVFEVNSLRATLNNDENSLLSEQITYINSLQSFYEILGITLNIWHIGLRY